MFGKRFALLASAAIAGLAPVVNGAAIGINFVSSGASTATLAPGDSAGVAAQSNWNNSSGLPTAGGANGNTSNIAGPTAGSLVNSAGALTATTVTWSSTNAWNANNTGSPDAVLDNGYLDTTTATPTEVVFSNVPYSKYDVYAYLGSDNNARSGHVAIGGQTFYFLTNTSPFVGHSLATATTLAGAASADYALFSGVTGSSFTLDLSRDGGNVGLHGIQIVDASTPEPGTLGLIGLGVGGFLVRRRRSV